MVKLKFKDQLFSVPRMRIDARLQFYNKTNNFIKIKYIYYYIIYLLLYYILITKIYEI